MFKLEFAAKVDRGLVRQRQVDVARVIPSLGLALVADGDSAPSTGIPLSQTALEAFELTFGQLGGIGPDAELLLTQIRTALARIGSGGYGGCLRCGESIGYARLRVRPESTLCRDCQSGGESCA